MYKYFLIFVFLAFTGQISSQEVQVIGIDGLKEELSRKADSVYVVNFWATWCKPCTEEMPDLLRVEKEYKDKNLMLILISLDLPSMKDTRLPKFMSEYGINSRVLLLDDPDANKWIPMVDESWSGSIPATLIYAPKVDYRDFHEGIITYSELKETVYPLIRNKKQ